MVRRTHGPPPPPPQPVRGDSVAPAIASSPADGAAAAMTGLERATAGAPPPPRGNLLGGPISSPLAPRVTRDIRKRLDGITGPWDEAAILKSLSELPPVALNEVLAGLDLHELCDDIDDGIWPLPKNRTKLFELLTVTRLGDLDVTNRAALITALQTGRTGDEEEEAIRNLFVGTRGPALTELKNRVDAGGDYRDLQQLLNHDIDSDDIRTEIMNHIAAHSGPPAHGGNLKLLSDIDDTLYANWKDERYPKGSLYPGVVAFYSGLAPAPGAGQTNLTLLTARPNERAGVIEKHSQKSLDAKGVPHRVILSGDFAHLLGDRAMADKKLENFTQYAALYPEYEFVFVGDSGQGDALLGAGMLAGHADATRGVFIHDIGQPIKTAAQRAEARERGIIYFDTYVGAAIEAHDVGLLDRAGLLAVVAAAEPALAQTEIPESTRDLLRRDIARAKAALGG